MNGDRNEQDQNERIPRGSRQDNKRTRRTKNEERGTRNKGQRTKKKNEEEEEEEEVCVDTEMGEGVRSEAWVAVR